MKATATKKMIESYVESCSRGRPVPLKSTEYEIEVLSGLAVVRQRRVFRNDEKVLIEAVMTFPVAFEGVVTRLEAVVAGRRLRGVASPKAEARETYEAAVDAGKASVLHEELLRGLHMVSVANVAPGSEIAVEATYVMPVSLAQFHPHLRIPQTVGDIYGRLSLPDSDQLVTGGQGGDVAVKVKSASGTVYVNGRLPDEGRTTVPLDDQIVLRIEGLVLSPLSGRAADGRGVELSFLPHTTTDRCLDIDLMIDVSGSMSELVGRPGDQGVPSVFRTGIRSLVGNGREASTKWNALKQGLRRASAKLGGEDVLRLWTFNDACMFQGVHLGCSLPAALEALGEPRGGTRLVEAVDAVVAARKEANVLLVTDGKSLTGTRLDIERIASSGARVTVVLIGGDALEARVGHLAAQSGGQMFVAHGMDASEAVETAVAAMRGVALPSARLALPLETAVRTASGLRMSAEWKEATAATECDHVAAFAASLALTGLPEEEASRLAASEGLVSHLTSLVLVDEEGEAMDHLPEQRKVALPAYGGGALRSMAMAKGGSDGMHVLRADFIVRATSFYASPSPRPESMMVGSLPTADLARRARGDAPVWPLPGGAADVPRRVADLCAPPSSWPDTAPSIPELPVVPENVGYNWWIGGARTFLTGFKWEDHTAALSASPPTFDGLPLSATATFMRLSTVDWVVAAASEAGVDPRSLAVGLLALLFENGNRAAARLARRLLKPLAEERVASLKQRLDASI